MYDHDVQTDIPRVYQAIRASIAQIGSSTVMCDPVALQSFSEKDAVGVAHYAIRRGLVSEVLHYADPEPRSAKYLVCTALEAEAVQKVIADIQSRVSGFPFSYEKIELPPDETAEEDASTETEGFIRIKFR